MTTYHVLRTIADDGTMLTDQPAAGRIVASAEDYFEMSRIAGDTRRNEWQHKETGEIRVLTENDLRSATHPGNLEFMRSSKHLRNLRYALIVSECELWFYEPKAVTA